MSTTPSALRTAPSGGLQATIWLIAVAAALSPGVALAHTGIGVIGGFQSGFTHPIFGLDHVVAMVAVGLWGAFLGQPAIWLLPVVFPVVMAFGVSPGCWACRSPGSRWASRSPRWRSARWSALALRPPLWVAAVLVGAFAIFHGHAHGTELPEAANPLAYGVGFVIATGLLHLSGIALGFCRAGLPACRPCASAAARSPASGFISWRAP